jgi:hypothetical protein
MGTGMCRPLVECETARSGDPARVSFSCRVGIAARHLGSGSLSAPPCGTGLSATLKPRFAGLHPSGFHPWRKDSRADAQFVSRSACGVATAESESADRVCRDGFEGRERGFRHPSRRTAMSRHTTRVRAGNDRASLYAEITDKIIAELETGRIPWVRPWGTAAIKAPLAMPRNAATLRGYSVAGVRLSRPGSVLPMLIPAILAPPPDTSRCEQDSHDQARS